MAVKANNIANSNNWSLAAAWKPADAGLMPSVSTGLSTTDDVDNTNELNAWYIGLEWDDVIFAGNSLGAAIGTTGNDGADTSDTSTLWEVFYSVPVTDNIRVTPAIFGIEDNDGTDDAFGGIVKTTFTF